MTGGVGFSSQGETSMRNNRNALGRHGKNLSGAYKTGRLVDHARKKMNLDELSAFSENMVREEKTRRKRQLIIFTIVVIVLTTFTLVVISTIN